MPKLNASYRNLFLQFAIVLGLMVAIIVVFFYGSQVILNTSNPVLTIDTGSMCIPYAGYCDGLSHPFSRTLHIGDLLFIQGINVSSLNVNYPDSDIIVFHDPRNYDRLIVHRIVGVQEKNGTLFFQTKGDGNGPISQRWPNVPSIDMYDPWGIGQGFSEELIVGKVVARVPWVGHIILFIRQNPIGLPLIIVVVFLLVVLEFILPILKNKAFKKNREALNIEMFIRRSFNRRL